MVLAESAGMDSIGEEVSHTADASVDLDAIATIVRSEADRSQGNGRSLLALLRLLEALHREIRDGLFQDSLPVNRQALYAMLKDMEAEGGWPYIHRMKLREVLVNLPQEPTQND
jgi:hypothetical protein